MKNPPVLSYPGTVTVCDSLLEFSSHEFSTIKGHNSTKFYYNIQEKEGSLPPYFNTTKRKKYHNQGIRENFRYLGGLFTENSYGLSHQVGGSSINITLDKSRSCIVTKNQRSEVYIPIAFQKNKVLVGGIYANIWDCGVPAQKSHTVLSIGDLPVTSIVSGICLFGNYLRGIDSEGTEHPLTNPSYVFSDKIMIEKVMHKTSEFHPYEKQMYATYKNLIPFFSVLGNGTMPKLYFQIPLAEYILYGLNLLLNSQMTLNAFNNYTKILMCHAKKHKEIIENYCRKNKISLDIRGPMDALILDENDNFSLDVFMQKIHITPEQFATSDKYSLTQSIINNSLEWFSHNQSEPFLSIYTWAKKQKNEDKTKEHQMHAEGSVLSLNYLSYIVKIASAKVSDTNGRVCLAHPYHEKQMALSYKSSMAEKFGEIMVMNWIPPVFLNSLEHNFDYYMQHSKTSDFVNKLIKDGIIEECFIEAGLHALNQNKRDPLSEKKSKILSQNY